MIHQPFWNYQNKDNQNLGRTFHGIVGCGYGGGLNPGDAPKGERIVTSTRSHSTGLNTHFIYQLNYYIRDFNEYFYAKPLKISLIFSRNLDIIKNLSMRFLGFIIPQKKKANKCHRISEISIILSLSAKLLIIV